ncbi:MAG: ATP-dependent RNA helicase HrpA [Micrococcaceae bacterium]
MMNNITYPDLPVSQRKDEIEKAIAQHQVVIIAGETGSGKTTQIPKMCLEMGRGQDELIGHTQPRRLAAKTVAERIAEELQVPLGQEIGFQVRFTDDSSDKTRVKVMTDGILLNEIYHDKLLRKYDTLIIDEAHERSLNIDFILGYLKQLLPQRPDLKVIITSATIDPEKFSKHFDNAPIISVSGRTYPVEIRYQPLHHEERRGEDKDLTDGICEAVVELSREAPGDILIFLPGEREIKDATKALEALTHKVAKLSTTQILPLFARLSLAEQHKIFTPGKHPRIVLATNVAETSLTVPGIKYVIDTGTARISRYSNRTKVQRLPIEPISQASAQQRSGRSGRVSDGIAIRLYSEEDYQQRTEFTDPEIHRTNLSSVILQMFTLGFARNEQEVQQFPFVEPPAMASIGDGMQVLAEIGAIKRNKGTRKQAGEVKLTKIGWQIAKLPVDPRFARMIIESARRDCVQEILIIVAALGIRDPRERPQDNEEKAKQLHRRFKDDKSDFISYLKLWAYIQQQQQELSSSQFRKLCKREYLSFIRIREWQDMYRQLRQAIHSIGIKAPALHHEINPARNEDAVHKSILSALLSQIGYWDENTREYRGARGVRFSIFPSSNLFGKQKAEWIVTAELVETSKMWARLNAVIDPQWVVELAGTLAKTHYSEPHWRQDRGSVMAYQKVTVYGLPVIERKLVQYGKINPTIAREMFIWHALVLGQWDTHYPFFKHNREVLEDIEALQERTRRYDLRVNDDVLADFYEAHIPHDVVSGAHFNKWYKHASHNHKKLLFFDESLVATDEVEDIDAGEFPLEWEQAPFTFTLDYSYDDGVSLLIPLEVLNQVENVGFDWLVPGMRAELVAALIKSLPKQIRKNYVPSNDVARKALEQLGHDTSKPLTETLASILRTMRGVPIPKEAWDWDKVPQHLKMQFLAVNHRGHTVGESRSLSQLQKQLKSKTQDALSKTLTVGKQKVQEVSKKKLTKMPEQPLNMPLEQELAGHKVKGYPALVDEGQSVAFTISESEQTAMWHNKRGITRLLLQQLPDTTNYIQNHLTAQEKLTFAHTPYLNVKELLEECRYVAVQDMVGDFSSINTEEDFKTVLQRVKENIIDETFAVTKTVEKILSTTRSIEKGIKRTSSLSLMNSLTDARSHLESLVYRGFIQRGHLNDVLRYLSSLEKRITKMQDHAQRDNATVLQLKSLEEEYCRLITQQGFELKGLNILEKDHPAPEHLHQARWMLEELRISLFTPDIKTAYTVSEKRLRKVLYP